jgi:parallel beta-helix repeat protein
VNINQIDCVATLKGIDFNTFKDSPGLVVSNGHFNVFVCGICGHNATQSNISNLLIYKMPITDIGTSYCLDFSSSNNISVSNINCVNQSPTVLSNGPHYGIRLKDSNYAMLSNNSFIQPSCGVLITGSSSENFGKNNATFGKINGSSTGAVCDTSGGVNGIGTGSYVAKASNSGVVSVPTSGTALTSSATRNVFPGEIYRVTASMQMISGGGSTEAIASTLMASDATSTCDFGTAGNKIEDRRTIAGLGSVSMNSSGMCTVMTGGTMRFILYGTSVTGAGQTLDKGAQIIVEQQ